MADGSKLDRRDFLRATIAGAVTTALAACGGTAGQANRSRTATTGAPTKPATSGQTQPTQTTAAPSQGPPPTAQPTIVTDVRYIKGASYSGKLAESPQLAAQVKAGKLPPVEKRLPEHPYVLPHKWMKPGKYGGTMNWICTDSSDWSTTHLVQESLYGHSPLRWLADGHEIGPGLAESWEANDDLSVWTLHFRKGLRWSDGKPWTVDDMLFWYEDEVGTPELNESPPQELWSGKGHPVKMNKVDDYTLELRYDSPTPLTADYACAWVKRGIGPGWMQCKHYMQQFHIKYNKKLNPKKWTSLYWSKADWTVNPDNPTMTGWKLKQYKKGQYSVWERNPYYWCIDRWGHQLPFIDGIVMTNVQDPQVMRLNIQQGKADFALGALIGLGLSDVSSLKSGRAASELDVIYWDSGSGTGSGYFFNYDYRDPKYRKLFRNPKFRQALSLAFDREVLRKTVYYNQAETTTGTMSPKSIEYHVGQGPQVYAQWRDSFKQHDPERATRMLDELGLKDVNGDGWRELPDGSKLRITLDYDSSYVGSSDSVKTDEQIAKGWQAVGINANLNPVSPTGLADQWAAGKLMSKADFGGTEVSDGANCLVYPQWLISNDNGHWAPLEGQWFQLQGTPEIKKELNVAPYKRHPPRMAPEKGGPIERLWKLYAQTRTEPDFMKRTRLVWEIMKIHVQEGPFFTGVIGNYPVPVVVRKGLMNVPGRDDLALHGFTNPWVIPAPATYDPEGWFWDNPEEHS